MKKILIFLILLGTSNIFAQKDSIKTGWKTSGITGLNLNQVLLENWTQGGQDLISWTVYGKFSADYISKNYDVKNNLKLSFGKTKLGKADFITNDNEVFLENILTYKVGWSVQPYASNTFRSVLANGYDYSETPKVKTSKFFDPAYFTQSIGFLYEHKVFTTRLGLAFHEVITDQFKGYSDDLDTKNEVESFKFETGLESVTSMKLNIKENLLFESDLRLFTRFDELDVWDVRWDNTATVKISDYFNVNLNIQVIYEKQQSLKTQLKEALQLGITYTLF